MHSWFNFNSNVLRVDILQIGSIHLERLIGMLVNSDRSSKEMYQLSEEWTFYSMYILYDIPTVTRLDSYDVHQKSLKDFAEVINFNPANIYQFKVNNRNIGNRSEICSNLSIKTPEQRLFLLFRLLL